MAILKGTSSVYGGVSAVNREKGNYLVTVHVAGMSFQIPGGEFLKRKRGRYPKVLVLYRRSGVFPENAIIGILLSPPSLAWRTVQEAARKDELTHEMLMGYHPVVKTY